MIALDNTTDLTGGPRWPPVFVALMSALIVLVGHKPHQPIHSFRRRRAAERDLRHALPPRGPMAVQLLDDDAVGVHRGVAVCA